ncbi:MAG: chromate transporter, partial [Selenomonadaceae bacterium]|nr:chromate transporter [Selenomonadaceae bacterium]
AFLHVPLMFQVTGGLMLLLAMNGLRNSISQGKAWRMAPMADAKGEMLALAATVVVFALPALWVSSAALAYVGSGFLSSLMSFGGGDAYLTVADGLFVETAFVTEDEFYGTIVPLVNLLPGSILCKTLTGVGYFVGQGAVHSEWGAYLMAVAGFAASIAASCGVFTLVRCIYREFQQLEIFRTVRQVIRPIVSGLLLTVALALFYQARKLGMAEGMGWWPVILMMVLSVLDSWLYFGKQMVNVRVLLVSCALAMVMCNYGL